MNSKEVLKDLSSLQYLEDDEENKSFRFGTSIPTREEGLSLGLNSIYFR